MKRCATCGCEGVIGETLVLVAAKRYVGCKPRNLREGRREIVRWIYEYPYVCSRVCAQLLDPDFEKHETVLRKPHLFEHVGADRYVFAAHASRLRDEPEAMEKSA